MNAPTRFFVAPARFLRVRHALVGLLTVLLAFGGLAAPAWAATGVFLTVSYGTTTAPDGTVVVTPGTQYQARLQYERAALVPGSTVVLEAPAGVRIPDSALVLPAGNTIFESLTRQSDGSIAIKILDDLSGSPVNQGVFTMSFTVDDPDGGSNVTDLTWRVDGEGQTVTIIVKKPGDEILVPFSDRVVKGLSNTGSLNSYVSIDSSGTVTVNPAIANVAIRYTLNIDSDGARNGIDITDTLDPRMEYVAASFATALTTWDENGLNKTTAPLAAATPVITGNSFTYSDVTLPADSKLAMTYTARLSSSAVAALQAQLQAKADLIDRSTGGSFTSTAFINSLTVTGVPGSQTSQFTVAGSVAGPVAPNYSAAMAKSSSLANDYVIMLDAAGALAAPVDLTYSLGANLTVFTPESPLNRNVVVVDTLPAQTVWLASDPAFISMKDETSAPVALTQVAGVSAVDFAGDAYVGAYQVTGQALWINYGHDTAHRYTAAAKAQIISVAGVSTTSNPSWLPTVQTRFNGPGNTAFFTFRDTGSTITKTTSERLVVLKDPSTPITDSGKFTKTAPSTLEAVPGSSIDVPFTFKVNAGYDFVKSQIIDYVDSNVFDLSDLDAIKAGITGMYDYNGPLTGDSFNLEVSSDGNLVLTASDTFADGWPTWKAVPTALTGYMTVTVPIPTKVLVGAQTVHIINRASLVGADGDTWTYTSTAEATGTTYGDEMEVHKVLYNDGEWTDNLRAEVDDDGRLISDEFIYRVELIPHGNFDGVTIIPVLDALPEGLEFLGFVQDGNLATGVVEAGTTYAMGGNIEATWIDSTRTLDMRNLSGTVLNAGSPIFVNFKVKAAEYTENVGITNAIGNQTATFTPSKGYPLAIEKQDSTNANVVINDRNARFTVTGPSGVVTDSAYVVNGLLKVDDGTGVDEAIVVKETGTYTITETVAPWGYLLAADPITVTVAANGSSPTVTYFNDPLRASDMGTVSIAKTVTGGFGGSSADFDFSWTAVAPAGQTLTAAQTSGDVVVRGNGVAVPLDVRFPEGVVVTFTEGEAPVLFGFEFDEVKFTGNPATVVGGENVDVSAENVYLSLPELAFSAEPGGELAYTGVDQVGHSLGLATLLTALGAALVGFRRRAFGRMR